MDPRLRTPLALAAIGAQILFVTGMLVLGAVEGGGYSAGRDDISDLAALTADHASVARVILALTGAVTIGFGLSLIPVLGRAAWLVALSLPALDNFTDTFFRLDCRAADAGCDLASATASWHGTLHLVLFAVAALATIPAPFVLSRRMRKVDGWADLAGPAQRYGLVVVAVLVATGATGGTALQGWTQRAAIVVVTWGIVVLAWRVVRLETGLPRSARLVLGG